MKGFDEVQFDFSQCRKEVGQFRTLLDKTSVLEEAKDILPFFRDRPQLSALCGIFHLGISRADRVAWEFDLFGDFQCDLVVGDSEKGAYCFIEFEDAGPDSIFKRQGKKATREWSPRFDHGYSQIIDWFYKLRDQEKSEGYRARFGKSPIEYEGLLVIGRSRHLDLGEALRFEWRRRHVLVDSKKITCVTFDELLNQLQARLDTLELVARPRGRLKG